MMNSLHILDFFSEIGNISPFSYFSNPTFVGNQVQYLDEIPAQQAKSLPAVAAAPVIVEEILTPDVPDESSRFFTSDEVYYTGESGETSQDQDEAVFFYKEESEETSKDDEDIVYYYKDIEPPAEETPEDSVSYPLYPPLAPAPPIGQSSTTNSQDLFREVTSPPVSQYKRENPGDPSPLKLVSKSAYTSNDLLDDTPSQYDIISNEPENLQAPDGQTFYFVGEVPNEEVNVEVNPPVSPTVYYKYPTTTEPPKAPVTPSPALLPEHRSEPEPPQKRQTYYRQEDVVITPPQKPQKYTYKTTTPRRYPKEVETEEATEGYQKYTYKTTTPKKPLEVPVKVTESYGEVYPALRRITTTEKVSISTEPNPPLPSDQTNQQTYSIFNDNSFSKLKGTIVEAESKKSPKSLNHMSFGFPDGSMKFEIPQEFRTFLNTPPKWINMKNW